MARGDCTFRQRDVTAAVKAVRSAGVDVSRVEVGRDGKIVIITGPASGVREESPALPTKDANEWDSIT